MSASTFTIASTVQNSVVGLFAFISRTSNNWRLARSWSFVVWSCRRVPVHSRGTYSSCNCCCCTPCGLVPQEGIAPGSRSGQFRMPNNEVRLLLPRPELLSNLALNPLLVLLRKLYRALCVLLPASAAALKLETTAIVVSAFSSYPFALCVFMAFPSHAIRNLVNTGVSGGRRSIDVVSREYSNFASQSQHTR